MHDRYQSRRSSLFPRNINLGYLIPYAEKSVADITERIFSSIQAKNYGCNRCKQFDGRDLLANCYPSTQAVIVHLM